jgi:hypothetical protein
MVVRLWKWFISWAEGLGMKVPPIDEPLVCGLVSVKLTTQVEEEGLTLVASIFSRPALLSTYAVVYWYSLLVSLTQN